MAYPAGVETPDIAPAVRQAGTGGQRTGRPQDHSSDAFILTSTLDMLAERDYDRRQPVTFFSPVSPVTSPAKGPVNQACISAARWTALMMP